MCIRDSAQPRWLLETFLSSSSSISIFQNQNQYGSLRWFMIYTWMDVAVGYICRFFMTMVFVYLNLFISNTGANISDALDIWRSTKFWLRPWLPLPLTTTFSRLPLEMKFQKCYQQRNRWPPSWLESFKMNLRKHSNNDCLTRPPDIRELYLDSRCKIIFWFRKYNK